MGLFKKKSEGGQGLKPLSYTPKTGQPQVDKKFLEEYRDKNVLVGALGRRAAPSESSSRS